MEYHKRKPLRGWEFTQSEAQDLAGWSDGFPGSAHDRSPGILQERGKKKDKVGPVDTGSIVLGRLKDLVTGGRSVCLSVGDLC